MLCEQGGANFVEEWFFGVYVDLYGYPQGLLGEELAGFVCFLGIRFFFHRSVDDSSVCVCCPDHGLAQGLSARGHFALQKTLAISGTTLGVTTERDYRHLVRRHLAAADTAPQQRTVWPQISVVSSSRLGTPRCSSKGSWVGWDPLDEARETVLSSSEGEPRLGSGSQSGSVRWAQALSCDLVMSHGTILPQTNGQSGW